MYEGVKAGELGPNSEVESRGRSNSGPETTNCLSKISLGRRRSSTRLTLRLKGGSIHYRGPNAVNRLGYVQHG